MTYHLPPVSYTHLLIIWSSWSLLLMSCAVYIITEKNWAESVCFKIIFSMSQWTEWLNENLYSYTSPCFWDHLSLATIDYNYVHSLWVNTRFVGQDTVTVVNMTCSYKFYFYFYWNFSFINENNFIINKCIFWHFICSLIRL